MSDTPLVIYNGECPICAPEIRSYRRQAAEAEADLAFADMNETDLRRYGLDADAAARRLHVVTNGEIVSGIDAFLVIWRRLPRTRRIARMVDRRGVRRVSEWIYEGILAPVLFGMHKRRRAR